jgi:RNA polymerase sigma-70 factor, ECF subfamily
VGKASVPLVCILVENVQRITLLLEQLRAGNTSALNELTEIVYPELHRIAQRHLRNERPDHTLQPTALVHEAYLKLFKDPPSHLADRAHFLSVASQVMRRVLVEHARARHASRRGGDSPHVPLTAQVEVELDGDHRELGLLQLDMAIEALSRENQPLAQIIEMRYFGGMTAEESAEALGQSIHVVQHQIRLARAWLRRELSDQK